MAEANDLLPPKAPEIRVSPHANDMARCLERAFPLEAYVHLGSPAELQEFAFWMKFHIFPEAQ